jgi:hypothetical protein
MSSLQTYRLAMQAFQSQRLRRDYRDLSAMAQYTPVGEFFFEEMYGPRDFSDRDSSARKLQSYLHLFPGVHLRDIEEVLDLLELTVRLDDHLARVFHANAVPLDFDEPLYETYYRKQDNYDERLRQLDLVRSCLLNVFHLSRSTLLGIALHRSGLIARLAGIGPVHTFLTKGYDALRGVQEITHFSDTIYTRELKRLDRIYGVTEA